MNVEEMFDVGGIMEMEDKSKKIPILSDDDCKIMSKQLNKDKIILHVQREGDSSEGNVFVKLKEQFHDQFMVSKKLFASKKIVGMTLNEMRHLDVEML